jgi:FtsP/CotA-like multicopper oxidase with cupredoxin domain
MESGAPPTVRLVYSAAPARSAPLGAPAPLPANPLPERMNLARAVRVTLPIEGRRAAPIAPPQTDQSLTSPPQLRPQALFTAERGRTVVMAIDNRDAGVHAVHVHGHHFRLLDRLDDGWKPYWLDTLPVAPGKIVRIAFVADAPGSWRIESHALGSAAVSEHWFEVR